MDAEEFRKAAHEAVDYIVDYYAQLDQTPVASAVQPGFLQPQLPATMPQHGEAWPAIQADFDAKIMPGMMSWQHPNFLGFFPACTSYPSMLGELYSSAFSAPAFNWLCSPSVTELETVVLDWLADACALPAGFRSASGVGGGVIQGSASEAVVTVMVAARERFLEALCADVAADDVAGRDAIKDAARGKLVALASSQTHSSTEKAARIAGVRFHAVPTAAADEYALTGAALAAAIADLRAAGLMPFYVTASIGTTTVCAVDRLAEIAAVADAQPGPRLWRHVDAAYAGAAMICPELRASCLDGVDGFDSFDVNMHKWLLVNFDASCLFVRDRRDLTDALSILPPYLRSADMGSAAINYRDWQIPLGRRFRALKIWFVMRSYGLDGLRAHIRRTADIGARFAALVAADPAFATVTPPRFGLTVFQVRPAPDADLAACNALTRAVADRVAADNRFYLTASAFGPYYVMRVVVGSDWSTEQAVVDAFAYIKGLAAELAAGLGK
ncbi:pyridoxal phosphate-dependent transferase [Dipodascopsis tothii]|uniref:pyridoxal phosphate-dependent transferase n=1 Tax=Dipodascopsis tothii TaxID=44089 RepID=UPI0034CFE828